MTTDLTFLRILFTVLSCATFAGIVAWAWLRGRQDGFAEAAALPFDDSVEHAAGDQR